MSRARVKVKGRFRKKIGEIWRFPFIGHSDKYDQPKYFFLKRKEKFSLTFFSYLSVLVL